MPGNSKSGRKKKEDALVISDASNVEETTRPRGRPKKPKSEEREAATFTAEACIEFPEEDVKDESSATIAVQPKPTHASTLMKRNSQLSVFYDKYLGHPLKHFPPSRLPLKRVVLQRYREIKSDNHTKQLSSVVEILTKELRELWECSAIPYKDYRGCTKMVKKLIDKWVDAKQDERKSTFFQEDLDTLFDLRSASCMNLEALKAQLKKSNSISWEEDLNFFKGQLEYPQKSFMSPTRDTILDKKMKLKASKAAKSLVYKEKHMSDLGGSSSTLVTQTESASFGDLDSINIVPKGPRQSAQAAMEAISSIEKDSDETHVMKDTEWDPPVRLKRKFNQKPEEVVLTLPSAQIPAILAGVSTVTRTSARHELKLVSTLLKAGGVDINNTKLSVSTIRRQRKSTVEANAAEIRERVKKLSKSEDNDFLVLHCDGKIIQYLSGNTEDRIAIAISVPNLIAGQFLASPAIADGKGKTMANCLFETLHEYGLLEKVEAVVFDTTASNTGKWRGCVPLLEKLVKRPLLYLACRHHIPELFIKHANIEVRGPTTGPDDSLFKIFKKKFHLIDTSKVEGWTWPTNVNDWRYKRASDVLEWANRHMCKGTWPREDYRELVELTVIYLGGVVKRLYEGGPKAIEVSIRKPGALHRARFMASAIYSLKISLLHQQFDDASPEDIFNITLMAEYIALIHVPYFLKSPLSIAAPRQDRDFWIDIHEYRKCFSDGSLQHDMIDAVETSVKNHLWYLTEELVIFSLFDNDLPIEERKNMAEKLLQTRRPPTFNTGKPFFPVDLMCVNPELHSFIGERSWLFFEKLHMTGNWLQQNVESWDADPEYQRVRILLRDLKVVNDLAERCVKDVQTYSDLANDSKYREDILIVASDHRGVFQDLRKQSLH